MENLRKLSNPTPKPKDLKGKAQEYFNLGLTAAEIEKLTGVNKRSLERYMQAEKWTEQRQKRKEKERQKWVLEYLKTQSEPKAAK